MPVTPNVDGVLATPRRPPRPGRLALLNLIAMLAITACESSQPVPNRTGDGGPNGSTTTASSLPSTTATPPNSQATSPTTPSSQRVDAVPTIRITVGGQTVTGELNDSPTARDLAEQLPVDVTLADFNGVEKVGPLPRPLTMNGVPAGADPEINEIGYYQPTNGLVFYYGDVGYYNGIVRIGRLAAADMQLIQRQTGSFGVTIDKG